MTNTKPVELLQPLTSGRAFAGAWRCVSVEERDAETYMRFSDGASEDLELIIAARDAAAGHVLGVSQRYALSSDKPLDLPAHAKIARALVELLRLRDPAPAGGAVLKTMDLCISSRCGNRCIFCGDARREIEEPDTQHVIDRLREFRAQDYGRVEFSSREFFLRPGAGAIVREAKQLGFEEIHVVTNGQYFTAYGPMADFLSCGVTKLTLSLHSHTSELEAYITGNKKAFHAKLRSIENILKYKQTSQGAGLIFSVNTVLTPRTAPLVYEIIEFVQNTGVRRHNIFFPKILEHTKDSFDDIVPYFKDLGGPLSCGLEHARTRGGVISVVDVPPCIVPDHTESVFNRLRKQVSTCPEPGRTVVAASDITREKSKGEPCRLCKCEKECEGVFMEYTAHRGWGEFKPVRTHDNDTSPTDTAPVCSIDIDALEVVEIIENVQPEHTAEVRKYRKLALEAPSKTIGR